MLKRLLHNLYNKEFVQKAIDSNADLSEFKKKPSGSIILGISLIIISYVICWPIISLLGGLALFFKEPKILLLSPVIYLFSHIVFISGMALAGKKYSGIFFMWLTRIFFEKYYLKKNQHTSQ